MWWLFILCSSIEIIYMSWKWSEEWRRVCISRVTTLSHFTQRLDIHGFGYPHKVLEPIHVNNQCCLWALPRPDDHRSLSCLFHRQNTLFCYRWCTSASSPPWVPVLWQSGEHPIFFVFSLPCFSCQPLNTFWYARNLIRRNKIIYELALSAWLSTSSPRTDNSRNMNSSSSFERNLF